MLNSHLYYQASERVASSSDRITLPPSETLVMLGFVLAFLFLVFGRPLVAFGCVVATVVFAGVAAIAQTAPSVLAGAGGAGYLAGGLVVVLPALLPTTRSGVERSQDHLPDQ